MRKYLMLAILPASIIFCAGCSREVAKTADTSSAGKSQYELPAVISPDHCRITGTITSIDSTLEAGNKNMPCAKVPCTAVVKIDSVWGYGSGFPPLNTRKPITLKFKFTLGPTTKDLFPNMSEFYPGLKIGDTFIGDIQKNPEETGYSIFGYRKN